MHYPIESAPVIAYKIGNVQKKKPRVGTSGGLTIMPTSASQPCIQEGDLVIVFMVRAP